MKEGPQTWDDLQERPISVESACLSFDGTRIAAVFADKTLCIYDTTIGEVILPPFKVDESPQSDFSRDGKLIVSGGQALRLGNVQTGEEVQSFDINVYSLALSPDGTCIAAGCRGRNVIGYDRNGYNIRVINLELAKIPHPPNLFIPSGGDSDGVILLKGEIWPSPFEGHKSYVTSVAYSADGKQIASCSDDSTILVWDVSTGSRKTVIATFDWNYSVTFSRRYSNKLG